MPRRNPVPHEPLRRLVPTLADYRSGPLTRFLGATPAHEVGPMAPVGEGVAAESQAVVFAGYRLQDVADYRAAIAGWFRAVRVGGHLVIAVPHAFLYDRQAMLPSRWSRTARRLYTPASLLTEVEEALEPNSYRVRWLGDDDAGYDYARPSDVPPVGAHDLLLVLEKIAPPAWGLGDSFVPEKTVPDFAFEPEHTRIERLSLPPRRRILALKLDHLGDFIMGRPALERLRAVFPEADITLVVGSWNAAMAEQMGLFDRVIPFDIYPRNSSEEEVDVHGKRALFDQAAAGAYDLAIDLRTDGDTRFLLRGVDAGVKAGLGSKTVYPWLDIFLPADITRHHHETAWEDNIPLHQFQAQPFCRRTHYQISLNGLRVRPHDGALLWGPYRRLPAGRYLWEPFLELDRETPGIVGYDVALDIERVAEGTLTGPTDLKIPFTVREDGAEFEFRMWRRGDERVPNLRFYGGRLMKEGAQSVLHQSEYTLLLVELVALRCKATGLLGAARAVS